MSYKGRYYALCADGDPRVCCVRSDLLDDPAEKEAFEKKYGYPLEFPTTWETYRDQAEFFTRPDRNLYGAVDVHSRNSGAYQWMARFVSTRRFPTLIISMMTCTRSSILQRVSAPQNYIWR